MKHTIIPIAKSQDIPREYRGTPIGQLLEYHNLNHRFGTYVQGRLLVGMCIDYREHLRIPANFAFIIRAGGTNLRYSDFNVSYAIAVGGVRHIALIAHTNCGMVNLLSRKKQFIRGLVTGAGWERRAAEEHFMNLALMYEIGNEIDFILSETNRLRARYPAITVAPLLYKIEDGMLYCIRTRAREKRRARGNTRK